MNPITGSALISSGAGHIDKNEYVGRYNLTPVNDPKYKGFYALEWVADPTLKKKDTREFEEEVEKAVGGGRKRLAKKVGI